MSHIRASGAHSPRVLDHPESSGCAMDVSCELSSESPNLWATAIRFLLAHSVSVWKSLELKHPELSEVSELYHDILLLYYYYITVISCYIKNVQSFHLVPVDPVDPAATTSEDSGRLRSTARERSCCESKGTPGKPWEPNQSFFEAEHVAHLFRPGCTQLQALCITLQKLLHCGCRSLKDRVLSENDVNSLESDG